MILSTSSSRAVSIRIGTSEVWRMRLQTSIPSMSGSIRSSTISAGSLERDLRERVAAGRRGLDRVAGVLEVRARRTRRSSSRPRRPGWSARPRDTPRTRLACRRVAAFAALLRAEHERSRSPEPTCSALPPFVATVPSSFVPSAGGADDALADGGDVDPDALELERVAPVREEEADVAAGVAGSRLPARPSSSRR